MLKAAELSRENMIRNQKEMKELRSSQELSASSKERRDIVGSPELYVSNKFASNQKGGGI